MPQLLVTATLVTTSNTLATSSNALVTTAFFFVKSCGRNLFLVLGASRLMKKILSG